MGVRGTNFSIRLVMFEVGQNGSGVVEECLKRWE